MDARGKPMKPARAWLALAAMVGVMAACDDEGPSGVGGTPAITSITPSTVVGGDSVRISGRNFGRRASEVTVSVIGDTIPLVSLAVSSVADTSLGAQVAINLAGVLQTTVAVRSRTSGPATLIVIPNVGGTYDVDATVLDNPCDFEPDLVADFAEHLSEISWTVTQIQRPATGALTIATADGVTWAADLGPNGAERFQDTAPLGVEELEGDLDAIVAPAHFAGTLLLHQPSSLACGVLLGVDGRRTSPPILQSGALRAG